MIQIEFSYSWLGIGNENVSNIGSQEEEERRNLFCRKK